MQMAEEWLRTWICLSLLLAWARAARPRFDVSTDMGMVLVPADAEVDTAIFRLRATDQDADFPLIFEIIATTSPIVRVENLPCTLYNKVCQANVILTRRLVPGRLHDFVVRVRDSKGDVNSMQATISVTNATTPRDKIFPHLPSLIMVPEDTKPEKELDYLLVESNPYSGKPVYIELWQPKELFKIRQRQMGSQTKGIITLIGELDFETQSMYTLTMYATDPYTEPGKDTRNIAGLHVVVVVQDVQDVPPVFTLAPPLTKINNTVKPGDVILRVHAEDGDKGVPREVTYGLISEGNPFTPFFNVSETTGEIILARPLEELTKITHVGAPIVLKIVAEEIRTMRDEPPAQATIVELGLLLGEPGNSPPYFENDNYVAWIDENAEPGTIIMFTESYSTLVKDEDIGKAGVFALKLENNNGTFEISPAVAERTASFIITVRDNSLIDYEKFKSLRFKIVAQEVGPATNLSTSVPVTIFLRDINDNPPVFDIPVYEVTLSENANGGTRVVQVHATDNDAGVFGRIQYVKIIGSGSEAFEMNPDTGLITVSMGSVLDREQTSRLELTVEARDEDGRGLKGIATLIVNILDVNDNEPVFEKGIYEFLLNAELTNFTMPAFIKATDSDAEAPNNIVRYEIVHGNYENKFQLNEETGELMLREAINRVRKIRQNLKNNLTSNLRKKFRETDIQLLRNQTNTTDATNSTFDPGFRDFHLLNNLTDLDSDSTNQSRRRRAEDNPLFTLTARAYDLGVPHLSSIAQIRILRPMSAFARIVMFVMPGENPDPKKTAETLATITGSRVTIQEIKPYVPQVDPGSNSDLGKRSVVVARVEQNAPGTLVDVDKIRTSLAANGFGILSGMDGSDNYAHPGTEDNPNSSNSGKSNTKNVTVVNSSTEEVTVYKAEKTLLTWLLVLLGLLLLAVLITLIICCICPMCPFYMEPRKRRIHSSETLIIRSDGRPKRHMHRKPINMDGYCGERKEAWSADPARQHWQFNRRNTRNAGIASLPGDVVPGHQNVAEVEHLRRVASLRHDGGLAPPEPGVFGEHVVHQTRVIPMPAEDERIYMEDVEGTRNYEQAEVDSLRRHELDRGSDGVLRDGPRPMPIPGRQEVREQHFYRDGNAEVLRLVTRGDIEDRDRAKELYHANGKDILLQRFIEDQKLRRSQDLRGSFHESLHEADVERSMESHQRLNGPTEILIIPERLELQRQPNYNQRQHQQEQMLNAADVQRLIIERNYKSKDEEGVDGSTYRSKGAPRVSVRDAEVTAAGEATRSVENASYTLHDAELMRQNALLTRLLLEKEARGLNVPQLDNASFLETQSLPGQVAIATQTDRTAATQTEFFTRSRSDNEESEEDPRLRRKSKLKGKFETKEDFKKTKTIWVKTPIPEESRAQSGTKKATPTRTKIEVSESRKVSISPDVLKEITNSLKSGESGGSHDEEEDEDDRIPENRKANKTHKVTSSKIVCMSQNRKKVKESTKVDGDSTTPSPETKERSAATKGKIRKKIEKPPRKKLEKKVESEKSHFMEPSFRVLEREISSFQQKIREFGDKKLKMLKKEDGSKADKESEDDDGVTYGVSKKCEVTVKKSKKSLSRETSPTKITVEQRTKTSEEETKTRQQRNISSSDLEDSDKPKTDTSNVNESMVQCEKTKLQTRSQSKLRRQTHLESSDTKSSNEKIEKSEDSECKINKAKDSSSSEPNSSLKTDSTSSSGKDSGKQQEIEKGRKVQEQEKKKAQSQKVVTKATGGGIVGIKRKLTSSLKSKTVDERMQRKSKKEEKVDKTKSLTSDESKLTSPLRSKENVHQKKSASSEGEKSNRVTKSSTSRESMGIDIDKLVKDVKGAVQKEISSLTQAAKDAMNIKKSEESKDKKETGTKKVKEELKAQSSDQRSHSMSHSKQGSEKIKDAEKETKLKSVDSKEKREKLKNLKEKSKSTESSSSTKTKKSDEAISFIVIENKKTVAGADKTQEEETMLAESKHVKSQELDIKKEIDSFTMKQSTSNSEDDDIKMMISDKMKETKTVTSNKVDEIKKSKTDEVTETKKIVSDKVDETKKSVNDEVNETKSIIPGKVDETKKSMTDEVSETKKVISNKIDETQKSMTDQVSETQKIISDKIDETQKSMTDQVSETQKIISDKIDETQKSMTNQISETQKVISDKVDETKKSMTDQINEMKNIISDKADEKNESVIDEINETKNIIHDKVDGTKKSVTDGVNEIKQVISNKADETKKSVTDELLETKQDISDQIDETEKDVSDAMKETKESVTEKVEETKKTVKEKIDESVKIISDKMIETKENVADKIGEAKQNIIDKIDGTKKIISDKIDQLDKKKDNVSEKVDESITNLSDKVNETDSKISDKISEVKKGATDEVSETKAEVCNKIKETKKAISDEIDETKKMVTDKFDETKEDVSDKIESTQKFVSDEIHGTNQSISDKIDETKNHISSKLSGTANTISEKFEDLKNIASDKISGSKNVISDNIEKSKESVTKEIDKTKESIVGKIDKGKVADEVELIKENVSDEIDKIKVSVKNEIIKSQKSVEEKFHKTTAYLSDIIDQPAATNNQEISELKELSGDKKDTLSDAEVTKSSSIHTVEDKKDVKVGLSDKETVASQPKSSSLPTEMKNEEEKKAAGSNIETATETTESESGADTSSTKEEQLTLSSAYVKEVTKEILKIEKANAAAPRAKPSATKDSEMKKGKEGSDDQRPRKLESQPGISICEATTGDSSDDDSSSASDISSKTALRTSKPYGTPRHSVSSAGEEELAKSWKPPRQRWSSEAAADPLRKVDKRQPSAAAIFESPPVDKPEISAGKPRLDQAKVLKSPSGKSPKGSEHKSMGQPGIKIPPGSDSKSPKAGSTQEASKSRPVVVSVKRKEQQQHLRTEHLTRHTESRKASPRREKPDGKKSQTRSEDRVPKSTVSTSTSTTTTTTSSEQRKEIRSKHLKLHVSHHCRQPKEEATSPMVEKRGGASPAREAKDEAVGAQRIIDYGKDPEVANARSRYMAWYQQKRAEMERKRREKKEAEEEQLKPKWVKKQAGKSRKAKSAEEKDQRDDETKTAGSRERAKSSSEAGPSTKVSRLRIRPLVNVESEQLKAIVRQGRKLRRKEGARDEELPVQIFAPEKPPPCPEQQTAALLQIEPRHHLTQHSEYKYEKLVPQPALPFYLHPPPPPPHPSPEHFQDDSSDSRRVEDDLDSGIAVSLQGGTRLRHQQLLDKKSVFDIAYSEAAPTQLRSDSSTPPT